MAVTNGWGQGVINNTNGWGKLATNNIGAGSIYENSYSGDSALIGTSAAFSYSASSFTQAESNPTPTITGTAGGVFSGTSGLVFVSTSTGEIDLSASTIAAHVVTYTVGGVSSTFNLSVTSVPYVSTSSFSFDGVNDYFDLGTDSSLDIFGSDYSVSLWFNTTDTGTADGLFEIASFANEFSISKGSAANNIGVVKNGVWFYNIGTGLNDGNWHNVTVVSLSLTLTVYIDNVAYTSFSTGSFAQGTTNSIGRGHSGLKYFSGKIDEVSIWNTNLSSDAVTEIYNSGAPNDLTSLTNASSSNLKAWYKMGE